MSDISQTRLTETFCGRTAAVLLGVLWIAAMAVGDANAYSYVPMQAGLALVALLALSPMIRGAKVARLSGLGWCSLGIGVYFLVRCLCSFSVVESWREATIILGCGVFYVAGCFAAQGRSLRPVIIALTVALILNVAAFWLSHYTSLPMEWWGRPSVGPGGINGRPVSLFIYKNFAGTFFVVCGMCLAALAVWAPLRLGARAAMLVAAVAAVWVSAYTGSRSYYVMPAVMAIGIWILWLVQRLVSEEKSSPFVLLSAFVIVGGIVAALCAVLLVPGCFTMLTELDAHGRFSHWRDVCRLLPDTPLWGNGASSVQWLVMPFYSQNWHSLNYAHNEYLQAWVDYGLIGLAGVGGILVGHVVRAFRIFLSEQVGETRRVLTILALLCFLSWSFCSFADFYWHNFSIAAMTAFAAGGLAAPYPYQANGRRYTPLPAGRGGKGMLALGSVACIGLCVWLSELCFPAWVAQWEYNRLSRPGADESGDARCALIASLVPAYPSSALMDQYVREPRRGDSWEKEVQMFRRVLAANPHQLCMVTMLGKILTDHGRYAEAESLYRRYYIGDGMLSTLLMDWSNFYALNLLQWAQYCKLHGDIAGAHSRMAYALRIAASGSVAIPFNGLYRGDERVWETDGKFLPYWRTYLSNRRQDVQVMEQIGVPKDNSWMQPMEPGGKPALYRRLFRPEELETESSESPKTHPSPSL